MKPRIAAARRELAAQIIKVADRLDSLTKDALPEVKSSEGFNDLRIALMHLDQAIDLLQTV